MNWMTIARVAKVLAVVMFLLPWLVVSCNGSPLVEATGFDLVIGDVDPPADSPMAALAEQAEADAESLAAGTPQTQAATPEGPGSIGLNAARLWTPIGLALIVLGLILGFVLKPERRAAAAVLAATVAAIAVLGAGMAWSTSSFKSEMRRAMTEQEPSGDPNAVFGEEMERNMAAAMAQAIRVEVKLGYWLTLIFLAAGAGAAGMALTNRKLPGLTITVSTNPPTT